MEIIMVEESLGVTRLFWVGVSDGQKFKGWSQKRKSFLNQWNTKDFCFKVRRFSRSKLN